MPKPLCGIWCPQFSFVSWPWCQTLWAKLKAPTFCVHLGMCMLLCLCCSVHLILYTWLLQFLLTAFIQSWTHQGWDCRAVRTYMGQQLEKLEFGTSSQVSDFLEAPQQSLPKAHTLGAASASSWCYFQPFASAPTALKTWNLKGSCQSLKCFQSKCSIWLLSLQQKCARVWQLRLDGDPGRDSVCAVVLRRCWGTKPTAMASFPTGLQWPWENISLMGYICSPFGCQTLVPLVNPRTCAWWPWSSDLGTEMCRRFGFSPGCKGWQCKIWEVEEKTKGNISEVWALQERKKF